MNTWATTTTASTGTASRQKEQPTITRPISTDRLRPFLSATTPVGTSASV